MGDPTNAMLDATRILDIDEESIEGWNLQGNLHMIYGQHQDAIEAYSEAIRLNSSYARAYHNRGLVYLMSYRPIDGCQDLAKAIELGHTSSEIALKYFCKF